MNNDGLEFEAQFALYLRSLGYWVYRIPTKHQGQPADIFAARDGRAMLIDCKVCEKDRFSLARIEDNQRCAMEAWEKAKNGKAWFVIRTPNDGLWRVPHSYIFAVMDKDGFKNLPLGIILAGGERIVSKEAWDAIQDS